LNVTKFALDAIRQQFTKAVQLHRQGRITALEPGRKFADRLLLTVSPLHQFARRAVQAFEAFVERPEEERLALGSALGGDALVEQRGQFGVAADGVRAEFAPMVAQEIKGDAAKPGRQRTFRIELAKLAEGGDEDLLGQILRLVGIIKPRGETGANATMMAFDERGEGIRIPALGRAYPLHFVCVRHRVFK
jgi:hypothetical protein